ncbi:MAG: transcriptional activator NhaR [Acidobacteria bacterium]|nr:MAG: transcriptional activator NhaR [Acidobacteriota bacterium]
MEWLNYHHLLYFWTVARKGSIARACEDLRLAQPTISGQLRALEENLGQELFSKVGRRLVLTEVGQMVYGYADEIFTLGRELTDVLKGRPRGRPMRLVVGISDVIPKLIAYRVLQPALRLADDVQLICHEDNPERLLLGLSAHELDLVLTDTPAQPTIRVRVFSHLLGVSGITLFARPAVARQYRKDFPQSLDGAPFLLPMENSASRRVLDQWFEARGIRPRVVGVFQDAALLSVFGQAGAGICAAPTAIENEVKKYYQVVPVRRLDSAAEEFYAISIERKIKHPAVVAISETARLRLFAQSGT